MKKTGVLFNTPVFFRKLNAENQFPFGPGEGGAGYPLPSGIPSPEFGAGPGPFPAPAGLNVKTVKSKITGIIIIFFILRLHVK